MRKKFLINLFLISLVLTANLLTVSVLLAITIDEIKNTISDQKSLLPKIEEEIKQLGQKIDVTRQQGNSLKNEIKQIDLTRQQLQTSLVSTQTKIVITDSNINNLKKNIQTTEEKIADDKKILAETLRQIRETETDNLAEILASFNQLTDLWDSLSRFQSLNGKLDENITNLRGSKQVLEVNKGQKEQEKNKLSNLKGDLSDQKKAVEITKQVKDTLLTETKSKESAYQKLLADRKKKKQEIEAEIAKAEADLKFALDPSKLPSTGAGIIGWPLIKHLITQGFGNTDFAQSHQSVYNGKGHNGIDLAANIGTQIYSAGDGKIEGFGNTDLTCMGASFGKWVLVKHNNGLSTLYGHLSLVKVSTGQTVKRGEVIALSGNTGYSTGPHLHFSLYASDGLKISQLKSKVAGCGTYTVPIASYNAYLNPLNYL
ncbi:MAG: peptidoglycan DD-metalloendopeptidase family protein [Candidatus Vogelbacteria bacterium]|nr:peptidoglycan DD-metalloendopeptidase family protein [Candidatus Vogelbacteria bacterium]